MENPEERKNTKKPTRLISTTKSVSFREAKIRVLTLDALELRLSMFQHSTGPNATRIGSPEKTIERASEGISSYIYTHIFFCFFVFFFLFLILILFYFEISNPDYQLLRDMEER